MRSDLYKIFLSNLKFYLCNLIQIQIYSVDLIRKVQFRSCLKTTEDQLKFLRKKSELFHPLSFTNLIAQIRKNIFVVCALFEQKLILIVEDLN